MGEQPFWKTKKLAEMTRAWAALCRGVVTLELGAGDFGLADFRHAEELLGLPEWLVLVAMVGAAVGVFVLGGWFERRARAAGQV